MDILQHSSIRRSLPASLSIRIRRNLFVIIAALSFFGALALRLYRLDAQSLWLDEGGTWAEVTRRGWLALTGDLLSKNAAYPLYHLILKVWTTIAGDSEWSLRFPSALAGALAVVAVYAAAEEATPRSTAKQQNSLPSVMPLVAAILMATLPFALWHSQDAKAYSMLMCTIALLLWASLRALRVGGRRWWLVLGVAGISLFVHRLALLPVAALALVLTILWPRTSLASLPQRFVQTVGRPLCGVSALILGAAGVYGLASSITSNGWQQSGHIAAGPLLGLWLTLTHFALDRGNVGGYLGVPLLVWALPAVILTLWGGVRLIRDALGRKPYAITVLALFALPLLLFAVVLAFAPLYEARYTVVAFPAWILVLAYPFGEKQATSKRPRPSTLLGWSLVVGVLIVSTAVLLQPKHGQFSGDPVKEEWRAAIGQLAGAELHPDDMLILHPYYTLPLWEYYASRVTPDKLQAPVVFDDFGQGSCVERYKDNPAQIRECFRVNYERPFNEAAFGKKRALLLIAPDHARTIDPPKTLEDLRLEAEQAGLEPQTKPDDYGWVGLRFQFAKEQGTWPCGGQTFVGLETKCVSFPETYDAAGGGRSPEPNQVLEATFGGEIKLRGYSLDLFGGNIQRGGTLPITLYWEAAAPPTHKYRMFLHLCRDCEVPPLAQNDDWPLHGYDPAGNTTTWGVGDPVHDERVLPLPAALEPGRYTLLLGIYPEGNPAQEARLPVVGAGEIIGETRLVLSQIEIK